MTTDNWDAVTPRPLTAYLEAKIQGYLHVLKEGEDFAGQRINNTQRSVIEQTVKDLQDEVAKRIKDERYTVGLKHIGGPDYPLADMLKAREERIRFDAEYRARTHISQERGEGAITEQLVRQYADVDEKLIHEGHKLALEWLHHGLDDAKATIERLNQLGGKLLVEDALQEVKAWQNVGVTQGEDSGRGSTTEQKTTTVGSVTPSPASSSSTATAASG